jgi:hypothetical protein
MATSRRHSRSFVAFSTNCSPRRTSRARAAATELLRSFRKELTVKRAAKDFEETLAALAAQPLLAFEIALEWVSALNPSAERGVLIEAAAIVVVNDQPPAATPTEPPSRATISGFTGAHPRIAESKMELDYHEFTTRLQRYEAEVVPAFEAFQALKHRLAETRRRDCGSISSRRACSALSCAIASSIRFICRSSARIWPSSSARLARTRARTAWACCCSFHRPATAKRRSWNTSPAASASRW